VQAARVHSLLVETLEPTVGARAAITSRGAVLAGPDAVIDGADSRPPGWTDCPPPDTAAAPAVLASSDTATYRALGRIKTDALAARADITIGPGAVLSPRPDLANGCDRAGAPASLQSWGEPLRTGQSLGCERFFPVVHAAGDLEVTSGRGQGVLVVGGQLRIHGPFVYYGIVIVSGRVEARGRDVIIYGAVLSADDRGVVWDAAGYVRRSTCAAARASAAAARPYPVPLRGWAELF
jgi:hypothetical protein